VSTVTESTPERPRKSAGELAADWMEIGTLLAVSTFFLFSYFSGRVERFVVPAYVWLSPTAGGCLLAIGVARLRAHLQGYVSGELEESTGWQVPVSACVVVLAAPIVLALVVNPTQLSPEGARKRRVRQPAFDAELSQAFDWVAGRRVAGAAATEGKVSWPKKPTILDVVTIVSRSGPAAVEGDAITVIGQCDVPGGPQSKRFDLYRLVITCCIADATAVSLEITQLPDAPVAPGRWVRVTGQLRFDSAVDAMQPVIHATEIQEMREPSNPYL